jgi:N-methylhydantoinase A/oxoprolinase/acetone carboxylase beta subunit
VLSAVGLLCSSRQRDLVRSWPTPAAHAGLDEALEALANEAREAIAGTDEVEVTTSVDCRYKGQSHELTVASVDEFADEHRRRNGYAREDAPVEVVALRARARVTALLTVEQLGSSPVERRPTSGPTVIAEPDCTIWVPDGWAAEVASDGSWVLRPQNR